MLRIVSLLSVILCLACCKKEIPPIEQSPRDVKNQVLVLNEGSFNSGNASIDLYNPIDKSVTKNLFEANNQRPLGDVLQSAKLINGQLWLVLNNSGKIEVIDTATFKSINVISGLRSPRYLHQINNKVYVSDLYDEKISIIDIVTKTVVGSISEGGWVEQISGSSSTDFYFLNKDSGYIKNYVVSSSAGTRVRIAAKPFDLVKVNNEIYGGYYANDSLIIYNLTTKVKRTIPNALQNTPSKMVFDLLAQNWYIKAGNEVLKINSVNEMQTIFTLKTGSLYGMDLINKELYLSNAKDYVSNSELIRINGDGLVLDRQATGRITNGFMKLAE